MSPENPTDASSSPSEATSVRQERDVASNNTRDDDRSVMLQRYMEGYQKGDEAAFNQLYTRLSSELHGYLWYLCGDRHYADDLLQESFLQIHRVRRTYRPPRPVRPWAFAIARHVYQMDFRAKGRRRHHETKYPIQDCCWPQDIERLASQDTIQQGLSGLPAKRRESLVLHYALGFSFSEIGSLLGILPGTAKIRAYRGLKELRQGLVERREEFQRGA